MNNPVKLIPFARALLISTILSCMLTPSASAFLTQPNGSITVFRDDDPLRSSDPQGDLGRYFQVNYDGRVDLKGSQQDLVGLASQALFKVSSWDLVNGNTLLTLDGTLGVGVDAKYGNWLAGAQQNFENYRVSVLGFATDPNMSNASASGAFNTTAFSSINAGGGVATEVCFINGGQGRNCNGGRNGGVLYGDRGTFTLSLAFRGDVSQINFSDFGIRYQSINSKVYGLQDASGIGIGDPVPEPLTILGTGLALGFGGLFKKEYDKKKKNKR